MVGWMERLRRADLGPTRGGLDFGFSRVCNPSRHTGLVFSLGYFPSTLPYIQSPYRGPRFHLSATLLLCGSLLPGSCATAVGIHDVANLQVGDRDHR